MKAQMEAPWAELSAIVGAEHLRSATPADTVDGVAPQMVIEPGSAEEVARSLCAANAAGLAVIPRGGGTKMDWGNPPRRADLILSIARLDRVLEHAWSDMTATVEAGCTVEKLQRALGERGQRLALDPLWPARATIGGILATNDSGALRIRFGALRDLIIGITLALPDGTLAKSGGKVVKNVAGYDLPKLATGSLGTLGVITQAIFRLYPLARETRSVSFSAGSVDSLAKLAMSVRDSKLAFTGLQLRSQPGAPPQLDVRFEGVAAGIDAQLRHLLTLAGDLAPRESPAEVWNAREELWRGAEPAVIAKFSVLPSQLGTVCSVFERTAEPSGVAWRMVAQGIGLGQARLEARNDAALGSATTALRRELERLGGTLQVLHCPPAMKAGFDVWGSAGDVQPLLIRIKRQLDPRGTLNPGRFAGGI